MDYDDGVEISGTLSHTARRVEAVHYASAARLYRVTANMNAHRFIGKFLATRRTHSLILKLAVAAEMAAGLFGA
jgi:hypothetical protein